MSCCCRIWARRRSRAGSDGQEGDHQHQDLWRRPAPARSGDWLDAVIQMESMTLYGLALGPFAEFGFMRRALVGCLVLALSCGPIGTILVIRRMSLMGDALSHSVLPGAALGFIMAGLSLPAMSLGGVAAGLVVALSSGV